MRRVLLDTSAYSAFKRGQRDAVDAIGSADRLLVSSIVLGELRAGFVRGNRVRQNEAELARMLDAERVDVIAVDAETSERYAAIVDSLRRAGTPVATNDVWIAACAMQHGAVLLTADTDFRRIGQIVVELLPSR